MKRLDFPGALALGVANPEDPDAPLIGRLLVNTEKMPFDFIVDSPDPKFFNHLAVVCTDIALQLAQSKTNESFIGTHNLTNVDVRDADTIEVTAEPVAGATEPAQAEKQ